MKFILIRHGECTHNIEKDEHIPTALCSLTEKGKQQSIIAAENIKKIVYSHSKTPEVSLYYSPYERTKFLANEITKRVKCNHIFEEPLVSEIQCGKFFSVEQYKKDFPQEYMALKNAKEAKVRFWYRYKDGESPFDVYVRVCIFLSKLNVSADGLTIIVSHQITLRILSLILLNKSINYFEESKKIANGEIIMIKKENFSMDVRL